MSMSRADLIYRNLWVVVGWVLVVMVVYLSLVPSPPQIPGRFGDKGGHVLAYATLMFWFGCLYVDRARRRAAVGLAIMGLVLELLQGAGAHRFAEPMDMIANVSGIIIGWTLANTRASRALALFDAWLARPRR